MMQNKGEKGLNVRQLRFIDNYLMGKCQKKAYIEAGYKVKSENIARVNSSRLLTNANILAEIKRRKQEVVDRCSIRLLRMSQVAIDTIFEIVQNGSEKKGQLDACRDILDRAGVKLDNPTGANEPPKIIVTYEDEKK